MDVFDVLGIFNTYEKPQKPSDEAPSGLLLSWVENITPGTHPLTLPSLLSLWLTLSSGGDGDLS